MAAILDAPADTRTRILEAAFRAVESYGLSRFTVDDVARMADVSRQTVYRYFDSKDSLVLALVQREEDALLRGVRAAFEAHEPLEAAMREALAYCLRAAHEHPLLDRLLEAEPEVLLPYLTTRAAPVVARARATLEGLVLGRRDVKPEAVRRAADLAVRAVISYTLTPSDDDPDDVARETAHVLAAAIGRKRKERP